MKSQKFKIEFTPDKIKNLDFGILKILDLESRYPDTLTGLKIVSYFSARKK